MFRVSGLDTSSVSADNSPRCPFRGTTCRLSTPGGALCRVAVGDLSARNFGLLIAYVLPGFVVLWGLSYVSPTIASWLSGAGAAGPSVGGFLYVFLASVALGMTASAGRWAALDSLHHATGLRAPYFDFSGIQEKLEGFERLVADHYQYYQFYGNTLIAMLVSYPLWRLRGDAGSVHTDLVFLSLALLFFAGSRDALRIFYRRASQLLGESESSNDERIRRKAPLGVEEPPEGASERSEEDSGGSGN